MQSGYFKQDIAHRGHLFFAEASSLTAHIGLLIYSALLSKLQYIIGVSKHHLIISFKCACACKVGSSHLRLITQVLNYHHIFRKQRVHFRAQYSLDAPTLYIVHVIYTSHSFLSENISQQIDMAYYRSLYSLFHLLYVIVYLIFFSLLLFLIQLKYTYATLHLQVRRLYQQYTRQTYPLQKTEGLALAAHNGFIFFACWNKITACILKFNMVHTYQSFHYGRRKQMEM